MIVTHKLTLDLARAGVPSRIDVSQDDRYSRDLEIRLLANGAPYCPPEGCQVLIRYEKPDHRGGSYDVLPDGTPAWKLNGNLLTVALAPQVCTVPGTVRMVISFLRNTAQISCFELLLDVYKLPKGIKPSREYINVAGFVPQPRKASAGQFLQVAAVDDFGRVTVVGTADVEGKAPVKGEDYWTPEDRMQMIAELDRHLQDALAEKSQISPVFAESLEDCTDPTQLYLLPDGFIYAYLYSDAPGYTNLLFVAQSFDSEAVLNETGYMDGYYASSSSPYYGSDGACVLTGWIPGHHFSKSKLPPTLYIKGARVDTANSHCRIQYSGDKANIGGAQGSNIPTYYQVEELGDLYYRLTPAMRDDGNSQLGHVYGDTVSGYVRFSLLGTGENLIITFDEEIQENAEGGGYGWENTGHAFVADDYDDRIQTLEAQTENQEQRIAAVEDAGEMLPDYAQAEAEAVIRRVMAVQGENTFLLGAISDTHYGNNNAVAGVIHGARALNYIHKRIKLDGIAMLGDYTDGYPVASYDNAVKDFQTVNHLLDGMRGVPNFRLQGNHDAYPDAPRMIHRYVNAFCDGMTWGNRAGGYGYRDFEDYKLRIICVNTEELCQADGAKNGNSIYCSAEQYNWFAQALDLSGKADSSAWRTVILSHQPLDWYEQSGRYIFGEILQNYTRGTAWTSAEGDISCDFRGKNQAKLVGNIHGHLHNLLTARVFHDTGARTQTSVWRFGTPEACMGRENQYLDQWAEVSTYPKTAGTAQETSFCIYCIDLDTDTLHAICYGAGYDRSVAY